MVTSPGQGDEGLPDLPEAVETSLYEILLDDEPAQRPERLEGLCRMHAEHEQAIRARAAMMATGDRALDLARGPLAEAPLPERISNYHIESLLGEGGFGVVYRARQSEPVQRTVALKVLHPMRLDERSRWRFQGERQLLARMQHRNIAQIYDAGTTDDGLHYFAMEFVDGHKITRWCDEKRLSIAERVDLFGDVCLAVQHAHQRGVVHRDLTPNNVLVKDEGGTAVAKVIDFGVAKLLEEQDAGTMATRDGALIGTPGYMSPEQAGGGTVDTRTDVYALGVLLYELLAGDLPFSRDLLAGKKALELVRIVEEHEPRRLTAAWTSAAEGADEVAARRSAGTAVMQRVLRGDLQWIVRKAMAKDPEHRYSSAGELHADLGRYRASLPVAAREARLPYLVRRFVDRHWLAASITAGMLLAALGVVVTLVWLLDKIEVARDDAVARGDAAVRSAYAANIGAARAGLEIGDVATARRLLQEATPPLRGWEWDYLNSFCDTSVRMLPKGGALSTAQIAWVDEDRLFQIGADGVAIQWDPQADSVVRLPRFAATMQRTLLSKDRRRLFVIADEYSRVFVVDTFTGSHRDLLRVRSRDRAVTDIRSMALSPDGRVLFVSQNSGAVTALDVAGQRPPREVFRAENPFWSMVVGPDGDTLLAGDISGWLEHRAIADGALRGRCLLQPEGIKGMVAVAGGRQLICSGANKLHKVDVATMTVMQRVDTGAELAKLVLSADGRLVYGGSTRDSRLVAWRVDTLEVAGRFHGMVGPCRDLAMSPDGRWLACASQDTTRVWSSQPPQRVLRLPAGFTAAGFGVDPDGGAFAISNAEGLVRVWDAETCEVTFETKAKASFSGCALTRSAVYAAGDSIVGFALDTGDAIEIEPPSESVHMLENSADGQWLAGVSVWRQRLFVWRTDSGELVHDRAIDGICSAGWDERRERFLVGVRDGLASFDPMTGTLSESRLYEGRTWQIEGHGNHTLSAAGEIWIQKGEGPLARFASGDSFGSVAMSVDGRRVAAGDSSGVVRLFDLEGAELLTFAEAPRPLRRLAFVLGGRRLVGLSHISGNQCFVMVWGADLPAR